MNTISPEITVGEIAALLPASARVLEQLGIDFCCGGGVAFDQACRQSNLDPAAVWEEIQQRTGAAEASCGPDWQSAPLDSLIDHILSTHHVYMKAQLPRLRACWPRS